MIRTILVPHHNKVMLTIPDEYIGTKLEVLAFPIERNLRKEQQTSVKAALQTLLLQAPTWSDEEYADFLEARKHLNQINQKREK